MKIQDIKPIGFCVSKIKNICNKIHEWSKPVFIKCKNAVVKFMEFLSPVAKKIKNVIIRLMKFLWLLCGIFAKLIVRVTNRLKPGLFAFNLILSLYITIIVMLHNIQLPVSGAKAVVISSCLLLFVSYIIIKLFSLEFELKISRDEERKILSWKTITVFLTVSLFIYIIFMINFIAHYPGGISTDNVDQWKQVQANTYDNLHPAIHSMMIWLVTRIMNNYAFVIKIQILCFSLMSGYLAATIVSWGVKLRWIIVFTFILISPRTTYGILLFAWKDNAFTICLMGITAFMINIVFSDGLWLRKWYNIIAFSIVFALSSLIRHNGIFFTIPLLLFILFFVKKAKFFTVFTILASLLAIYGVTNGIYKKADVQYHEGHTYYESVGLPMTILGGVLVNKPEALDDETKTFLFKIASEQQWKRYFKTGDYNSVKWQVYEHQKEVIKEIPPKELLGMTLNAVKNAPDESLREFIALTKFVWDPFDWEGNVIFWNNGSTLGFMYTKAEVEAMQATKDKYIEINNKIKEIMEMITPNRILTSIGLNMLLLLIAGIYSINRNLGYKSLFLFIPSIAHNIGTMLLISGPEWRYMHFNTVITFPLILALLCKADIEKEEDKVNDA